MHLSEERWVEVQQDWETPFLRNLGELTRLHSEAIGGRTLELRKLQMGHLWGERVMCTTTELAEQTNLSIDEIRAALAVTDAAVRDGMAGRGFAMAPPGSCGLPEEKPE